MMSTSNQSYKELSIPFFKEVFEIVDKILLKYEIPYYLIGATALTLKLLEEGNLPNRGTKDIDFAIMVSNNNELEEVINEFELNGFKRTQDDLFRLYSIDFNTAIDLLPFGEIEQDFTINFNERNIDLHVLGFREVLNSTEQIAIEEKIVNIPSLPGMTILKLVAYCDRPESRTNDLDDLLEILKKYYDVNHDEILEYHNDLLDIEPFDRIKIGAESLGRNVKQYLVQNITLKERVINLLETNLQEKEKSQMARYFARKGDNWTIEYALEILKAFYNGINSEKQ